MAEERGKKQNSKRESDRWCGSLFGRHFMLMSFTSKYLGFFLLLNTYINLFLLFSIFSIWRSFDNNTINSIFGGNEILKKKKTSTLDCIYRRDETGLEKKAMSSCWLWMCGENKMLNMFFIIYLHFSEHSLHWMCVRVCESERVRGPQSLEKHIHLIKVR